MGGAPARPASALPRSLPRASARGMPTPTIVFDLDGTLIDTAPDLVDTLNVILTRHDVPPVAFDEARTMIGAGVKPLLQRALASKGMQFPAEEIDRLFREYLEIYAAHIADRSRPFSGTRARARRRWPRRAVVLAVCTNKLEWLSVKLLEELGLKSASRRSAGRTPSRCASPIPTCCA